MQAESEFSSTGMQCKTSGDSTKSLNEGKKVVDVNDANDASETRRALVDRLLSPKVKGDAGDDVCECRC